MKYALVNGERQEAQPGLSGKCPCCESPTISKCGKIKIPHWAHKGKLICDLWWENETKWHREWKEHFPKQWQEFIQYDENGEKHIADVKTDQEWAIEFQHSFIKPEERQSREFFYKKMIWIVDGSRRVRDKDKFINVWKSSALVNKKVELWRLGDSFEKCPLLRDWAESSAPVFFDFGENFLLGIFPQCDSEERYLIGIDRNVLITSLYPTQQEKSFKALLIGWTLSILDLQSKKKMVKSSQNLLPQHTNYSRQRRKHRRL